MPFDCKVGDIAFCYDGGYGGRGHWYIVLTNSNINGYVVRANFTKSRGQVDGGRVFTPKDDSYIFEFSTVVPYRFAKVYPCDAFRDEANRADVLNKYKHCPQGIMRQIIEDAFKSLYTEGDVLDELKAEYPEEYNLYYEAPED